MIRNRELIVKDVAKRVGVKSNIFDLPSNEKDLDLAMRSLACILCDDRYDKETVEECKNDSYVKSIASFLDERMCVPRDTGAMNAACIKRLAASL